MELIDEVYLGWLQDEQVSTTTCQNLKILYRHLYNLTGLSHVSSPDGLNHTLRFQGCILRTVPSLGMRG